MANAGALVTLKRRSQSALFPLRSRCKGAGKTGARSRSCKRPSLTRKAPAIRPWGSSASVSFSTVSNCVPASPCPSGTETRTTSILSRASNNAASSALASSVTPARSASLCDALSSLIITTISFKAPRSSRCKLGPANAASTTIPAKPRNHAPAKPLQTASARPANTTTAAASSNAIGIRGSKTSVCVIGLACQEVRGHEPDRICSCPSAHASPD